MGDATTTTPTLAPAPDGPDPADEKRTFLGLSLSQVAGSALAAVTTAVAASFLGVAGTLIGAAFGSVVSTVAGAAYATSLKTAATRVRTTRTVVVRPGPDGVRGASQTDPARVPSGFGAAPVTLGRVAAAPSDMDADAATDRAAPPGLLARVPWKPVAAVAALGFVLGLGLLTVTEGVLGRPVSDSAASGTTLGEVVGGSSGGTSQQTPEPAGTATSPAPAGSSQPAPDGAPSASAPAAGTATDPAGGAGPTPSDGAPTATDAPAATPTADASSTDPAAGAAQTP